MKIIFNPHKKLHTDIRVNIGFLKSTIIRKTLCLQDDLMAYEQNNLSKDGVGLHDSDIRHIKKHLSDLAYIEGRLLEIKDLIPKEK